MISDMLIISYMVTWFPFLYNLNELMSLVGLASVPREIFCIFFNQAYPFFMICFHYEAHTSKKKNEFDISSPFVCILSFSGIIFRLPDSSGSYDHIVIYSSIRIYTKKFWAPKMNSSSPQLIDHC